MGSYKVIVKTSAQKELRKIPGDDVKRIIKVIAKLSENPRDYGCIKLTTEDKYRVRCGDYRIMYFIDDASNVVDVFKIGDRKDIYRI